jgi:hypothetical protein
MILIFGFGFDDDDDHAFCRFNSGGSDIDACSSGVKISSRTDPLPENIFFLLL